MVRKATREEKLWEALYQDLTATIKAGSWPAGTRLPAEVELARQHNVSRNVLRSALKRLREEGFIVSRQGGGSIVTYSADARDPITKIDSIADLVLCFELRAAIEFEAAALASLRANADDIAQIGAALDTMRQVIEGRHFGRDIDGYVDADYRFHVALVASTHNPFFIDTMRLLDEQVKFAMTLSRGLLSQGQERTDKLVYDEHVAIYEAVRSRDAEKARTVMQRHLTFARHRILGDGVLLKMNETI